MQENPYHRELVEFFQFFQEWFAGTSPNTEEHFTRITDVLPEYNTYINPKGELTSGKSFLRGTRSAHGSSPGMRMWIDNFQLHWEEGNLALVTFEEWMQPAGSEPQAQMSTVIFRKKPGAPNGIEWFHTHETPLSRKEA